MVQPLVSIDRFVTRRLTRTHPTHRQEPGQHAHKTPTRSIPKRRATRNQQLLPAFCRTHTHPLLPSTQPAGIDSRQHHGPCRQPHAAASAGGAALPLPGRAAPAHNSGGEEAPGGAAAAAAEVRLRCLRLIGVFSGLGWQGVTGLPSANTGRSGSSMRFANRPKHTLNIMSTHMHVNTGAQTRPDMPAAGGGQRCGLGLLPPRGTAGMSCPSWVY